MTKIQFSDEFDIPYSRENYPWIGGAQCLKQERLFWKDLGQEQVLQNARRGTVEIGHDGLRGQGFPYKGPVFQVKVTQLKLIWRIVIGACYDSLTGVSWKCRLTQVQISDMGQATGAAPILWAPIYELTLSICMDYMAQCNGQSRAKTYL